MGWLSFATAWHSTMSSAPRQVRQAAALGEGGWNDERHDVAPCERAGTATATDDAASLLAADDAFVALALALALEALEAFLGANAALAARGALPGAKADEALSLSKQQLASPRGCATTNRSHDCTYL